MLRIARTVAAAVVLMVTLAALAALLNANAAHAAATPEQKCQKGRYDAAAKYATCQRKAMGAFHGGGKPEKLDEALGKCTVKYAATWPKLQKKAQGTGATCDQARFEDNADGTVTDWLTGLQWEQKTDDGTVHDKDNTYTWSTIADDDYTEDGSAFTIFLAALNGGGCFAGQCGWRLPTIAELQTILLAPYPSCATSPCIDPVFGPTVASFYLSSTTVAPAPSTVWGVGFGNGQVNSAAKAKFVLYDSVRAVCGGL